MNSENDLIEEFKEAISEEILAASKQSRHSGIPLKNGQKIGCIASTFHYRFQHDKPVRSPEGAPGKLFFGGAFAEPIDCEVVSIRDFNIIVSVQKDLGSQIPEASLLLDMTLLLEKLKDRLDQKKEQRNTFGEKILGLLASSGETLNLEMPVLNSEQLQAIGSALGRDTTYLWGPPGTGKTFTIGSIISQLFKMGRSVLLVSHTNVAVDQALYTPIERSLISLADLSSGTFFRVGTPVDRRLEKFPDILLSTHVERRSSSLTKKKEELTRSLEELEKKMTDLSRSLNAIETWQTAKDSLSGLRDIQHSEKLAKELEEAIVKIENEKTLLIPYFQLAQKELKAVEYQKAKEISECEQQMFDLDIVLCKNIATIQRETKLLEQLNITLEDVKAELKVISESGFFSKWWNNLPNEEQVRTSINKIENEIKEHNSYILKCEETIRVLKNNQQDLRCKISTVRERNISKRSLSVISQFNEINSRLDIAKSNLARIRDLGKRNPFENWRLVQAEFQKISDWFPDSVFPNSFDKALDLVCDLVSELEKRFPATSLSYFERQKKDFEASILPTKAEIESIDQELAKVETDLIKDARVIGTTLTRAYMREAIQTRTFDTVIIDEASMAAIPAIWAVASLASRGTVVVGDFLQLPPIVLAETTMAKKWLGRDVFEVAGVNTANSSNPCFVALREQNRMHPKISEIPNKCFYKILRDGLKVESESDLEGWYRKEWGYDEPVLTLNTEGAWVTSVPQGKNASRANVFSASVCAEIAKNILAKSRPEINDEDRQRVLIVTPYRAQAKLIQAMINEFGINREVIAGTAHSFQGSEAPIVILDLVNDKPHWKVAFFIKNFDEQSKRLLNVAITRARKRLIIIGNTEYICSAGKKAFLGGELLPLVLKKNGARDALPVLKTVVAYNNKFNCFINPETFSNELLTDFSEASQRIVVYSKHLSQEMVGRSKDILKDLIAKNVQIYFVSEPSFSLPRAIDSSSHSKAIEILQSCGVKVIFKKNMHESLILIDNQKAWYCSQSPFSHAQKEALFYRVIGNKIASEIGEILWVNLLVDRSNDENFVCPICQNQFVACEGDKTPFYWSCIRDSVSVDADDQTLKSGTIVCQNCGSGVDFEYRKEQPVWKCQSNRRHWQKVREFHYYLPLMQDKIPEKLRKVRKKLNNEIHTFNSVPKPVTSKTNNDNNTFHKVELDSNLRSPLNDCNLPEIDKIRERKKHLNFFAGIEKTISRPFAKMRVEEMKREFVDNPSEPLLQALMAELGKRTTNASKNFAAIVLSKFFELNKLPYSVTFDGRSFNVICNNNEQKAHCEIDFSEVLIWLKKQFEKEEATDSNCLQGAKSATTNSLIKPFAKEFSNIATAFVPEYSKNKLFSYQGRSSYNGLNLVIEENPDNTYKLYLKTLNHQDLLCSSAILDAAIAIAHNVVLIAKPVIPNKQSVERILEFNNRKIGEGQKISIVQTHAGMFEIDLCNPDRISNVCKNANISAANAILEYLISKSIF